MLLCSVQAANVYYVGSPGSVMYCMGMVCSTTVKALLDDGKQQARPWFGKAVTMQLQIFLHFNHQQFA